MCHSLLIQSQTLWHFKPNLSTSWPSVNLRVSIYFLMMQPAELTGLSSACPRAAACSALGLDLGCRTKSRGPG